MSYTPAPKPIPQPSNQPVLAEPKVEEIRAVLASPTKVETLDALLEKPAKTDQESKIKKIWGWIKEHPYKTLAITGAAIVTIGGAVYGGTKVHEKWKAGQPLKPLTQEEINALAPKQIQMSKDAIRDILPENFFKNTDEGKAMQKATNEAAFKFLQEQTIERRNLGVPGAEESLKELVVLTLQKEGIGLNVDDQKLAEIGKKRYELVNSASPAIKTAAQTKIDGYANLPKEARDRLLPLVIETEILKETKNKK